MTDPEKLRTAIAVARAALAGDNQAIDVLVPHTIDDVINALDGMTALVLLITQAHEQDADLYLATVQQRMLGAIDDGNDAA